MKRIIISISLLLFNYSFAQHNIFVKAGTNVSWFLNAENSEPKIGYSFGIDKRCYIFKGLSLEIGIAYTTRTVILKDQTIQPYQTEGINIDAYFWDINGNIGYIDFPISFNYEFILNKNLILSPIIGTTIAIPKKDYSNLKQKNFYKIYNSTINDWYDYDYHFEQESGFGNNVTRFIYNLGFSIQYVRHSLNLIYCIDNTKEYYFKNLETVKYKMNSIFAYYSYEL